MAKQVIDELYAKYTDDPFIFSKMHNYVCFKLPGIIDDMKRSDSERRERNEILSVEQDSFIHSFLNRHQYFYCPQTERFFYYDGVHYKTSKEDDVLHHVLSTITKDKAVLMPRKPQTKVYVMKRVKESNPLKSIPESETIQSVLDSLCPAIFQTKPAAKYFLAIIGDHLLKKTDETTHVYFATAKAKELLRELGTMGQIYFGVSATSLFKHKYHSHPYKTVRLLKMSDAVSAWRSLLSSNILDLFCVAAHYSERYECADKYLEQYSDDADLIRYTMHFRGKNAADVVADFTRDYLIFTRARSGSSGSEDADASQPNDTTSITTSTMEYLWRKYLKDRQFPTVLGQTAFLTAVIELLSAQYDEGRRIFCGITSPYLQTIERFQRFLEQSVRLELASEDDPTLLEYEIGELTAIYREASGDKRMTEPQMLDLIRFYHPEILIIDNKYIQGIYCSRWNKKQELDSFFEELLNEPVQLSFYDAYTVYLEKNRANHHIISKSYFEKYICCVLTDRIRVDGLLEGRQYKDCGQMDDIKTENESECADSVSISVP